MDEDEQQWDFPYCFFIQLYNVQKFGHFFSPRYYSVHTF